MFTPKEEVIFFVYLFLELLDVESVWIELSVHKRKLVIGTFYRSPNSTPSILSSIENSVGLAFETNIRDIIITGAFNLDRLSDRTSKKTIKDFVRNTT